MVSPLSHGDRFRGCINSLIVKDSGHGAWNLVVAVAIVSVVLYAAVDDRLVAAIVAGTGLVAMLVTVWWRRTKRGA